MYFALQSKTDLRFASVVGEYGYICNLETDMTNTTRMLRKLGILITGTIITITMFNLLAPLVGTGFIGNLLCFPFFFATLYLMDK